MIKCGSLEWSHEAADTKMTCPARPCRSTSGRRAIASRAGGEEEAWAPDCAGDGPSWICSRRTGVSTTSAAEVVEASPAFAGAGRRKARGPRGASPAGRARPDPGRGWILKRLLSFSRPREFPTTSSTTWIRYELLSVKNFYFHYSWRTLYICTYCLLVCIYINLLHNRIFELIRYYDA